MPTCRFFSRYSRTAVLAIILGMLSGCGIQPFIDYRPGYDFTNIKHYRWLDRPDQQGVIDLRNQRIQQAITQQLENKQWQVGTHEEQAYLLLTYHFSIEDKLDVDTFYHNFGLHRRHFGFDHATTVVREYEAGTLVIDFIDPNTKQVVWSGSVESELQKYGSPEERQARTLAIVTAILDDFPPGLTVKE